MNLKQIIRGNCACYFSHGPQGTKNWCEKKDKVCMAFRKDFFRCGYFEQSVLPAHLDGGEYIELLEKHTKGAFGGSAPPPQMPLERLRGS